MPLVINYLSHFTKISELTLLLLIKLLKLYNVLTLYPDFTPIDLSLNHICFNSLIPNPC